MTGHSSSSLTRVSKSLSDFLLDTDYTNIWETSQSNSSGGPQASSSQRPFSADATLAEAMTDPGHSLPIPQADSVRKSETDIVKLAARSVSGVQDFIEIPGWATSGFIRNSGFFFFYFRGKKT